MNGEDVALELARHPVVAPLLERCTFPVPVPGEVVDCAVSGGADSSALLVLAVASGLSVCAVHIDHGLRPRSDNEGAVVAALADRFGAASRLEAAKVEPGPNLEARARDARYELLGPDALTGHTADDQAETVLLNLMRGAGVRGLAGIRPESRRPLLALRRSETEAVCRALDINPIEDPSNRDPAFRRNRVRHELLPLLDDIAERDVAGVIARQSELLAEVDDLLHQLAQDLDVADARALRQAHPALARVAIRSWLGREISAEHPVDGATVERVMSVAAGDAIGTEVGHGWWVRRTENRLRLSRS